MAETAESADMPRRRSPGEWAADGRVRPAANAVAAALAFYFVQQWFWPAPVGVLIQGVVIGGLTALVAIGISLIYRANRIINFAQGDLGAVPATLTVVMVSQGVPFLVAVGTGLAAAVALGAAVEYLVIRRFFRAPRLILTVATIGIGTLMAGLEVILPQAFGLKTPPQELRSPFNFTFTIRPIVFHGNDVVAVIAVPLVIAGLAAFFRFSNIGIAVRASAEAADRASLLGVPVKRINTIVWVIATVLATVALILRAGVVGLPIGSALGIPVLVQALTAAVIARMEKLPTIVVASIAIGIIEQAVVWHTGKPLLVDGVLFVVIIGALLVQRRRATRLDEATTSSWQSTREVRPIPRELAGLPEVRWSVWALGAALAVGLMALPAWLGEGRTNLASALVIYVIVAVSLVVLTGWAGQVSLGQFAFVGVGAAVGSWMTLRWQWDLSLVLIAAGLIGAAVAVLIGLPAIRIKGLFLAVSTLSFALATSSYLLNGDFVHWIPDSATRIPRYPLLGRIDLSSETRYYEFTLACLLLVLVAVRNLRRSRTGRVLVGVRENERAALAYGVSATRAKLVAFAVSGFLASFAGALLVHQQQNLLPNSYTPYESEAVFVMVVIGGLGSIPGAALGAVYLQSFAWFSSSFPSAVRPAARLLGSSVGLVIVLMFLPSGLGSVIYDLRDRALRKVAARRSLVVPSLIADSRTPEPVVTPPADEEHVVLPTVETDAAPGEAAALGPRVRWSPSRALADLRAAAGPVGLYPVLMLLGVAAVERFDFTAFSALAPEIRRAFGLSTGSYATIASLTGVVPLVFSVPLGYISDRTNRVRVARIGALVWGVTAMITGFAPVVAVLILARIAGGSGQLVNEVAHPSLLSDYHEPERLPPIFSFYRAGSQGVALLAGVAAGGLGALIGWRATFVVLALPTFAMVLAMTRLREPARGQSVPGGAAAWDAAADQPGFFEARRSLAAIRSLRRTWGSAFLFGAGTIPFATYLSLFFDDVFHLGAFERGAITSLFGFFGLLGFIVGGKFAMAEVRKGRFGGLAVVNGLMVISFGGGILLMALAPIAPLAIAAVCLLSVGAFGFLPAYQTMVALVVPPRIRSQAFAWSLLFYGLGAVIFTPIISAIADGEGQRPALTVLSVIVVVGGAVVLTAARFVPDDLRRARSGEAAVAADALLAVRGLDVAYDGGVQVLFGVDMEVRQGQVIALLGTNGAGKSTLLRAISGLLDPIGGAISFDGRDVTHADAVSHAQAGIVQVPGGRGVFPSLTVAENLRIAGWLYRRDPRHVAAATARVYEEFPILATYAELPAANLSGGQQQMLTIGQALIAKPRLLMIDELSLGLAPVIVEQLLRTVRKLAAEGTTIILVEQSVNVALTIADTAYFMEKGEVRFHGPTAELLSRPDVLRSVFLEGAGSVGPPADGHKVVKRASRTPARAAPLDRETVLSVSGVTRRFGGVVANEDVSFDLHRNEILGIIGPNGAGKTTLFDLISGFTLPDSGHIELAGMDISTQPPDARAKAGLGRSFQDARLFPGLTVADTIALSLELHIGVRDPLAALLGLPAVADSELAVRERVDELIDLMGLDAYRDKFVGELSTGSRRVVDLACILAQQPRVILFDEPSSGIAQRETEALAPLLRKIRDATGASLLVIEHDMPLVTGIADELLALDLGRVVTRGTPDEVVNDPQVVASYLGGSPDSAVVRRSGAAVRPRRRTRTTSTRATPEFIDLSNQNTATKEPVGSVPAGGGTPR